MTPLNTIKRAVLLFLLVLTATSSLLADDIPEHGDHLYFDWVAANFTLFDQDPGFPTSFRRYGPVGETKGKWSRSLTVRRIGPAAAKEELVRIASENLSVITDACERYTANKGEVVPELNRERLSVDFQFSCSTKGQSEGTVFDWAMESEVVGVERYIASRTGTWQLEALWHGNPGERRQTVDPDPAAMVQALRALLDSVEVCDVRLDTHCAFDLDSLSPNDQRPAATEAPRCAATPESACRPSGLLSVANARPARSRIDSNPVISLDMSRADALSEESFREFLGRAIAVLNAGHGMVTLFVVPDRANESRASKDQREAAYRILTLARTYLLSEGLATDPDMIFVNFW